MAQPLISIETLKAQFAANQSWDKQYRLIIQFGKKLPAMEQEDKTFANEVQGCESLAWLTWQQIDGCYYFCLDSDTRVVKGLMMILLIIFQGKTKQQISDTNIEAIFAELKLLNHLSPSRANGLLAIVDKIQSL